MGRRAFLVTTLSYGKNTIELEDVTTTHISDEIRGPVEMSHRPIDHFERGAKKKKIEIQTDYKYWGKVM